MIDIRFNTETVSELHSEMAALLRGTSITTGNVGQGVTGPAESNVSAPKRQTAAEKKAADIAAIENKVRVDYAAKEASLKQNISTGEERTDPENKQDAADEAADTKAATPEPLKLTHDSIRAMLGGYVQAYGMAAAQEDGVKLIGTAKISELKDEQRVLAAAVVEIATGIEKNPHKRAIAGDGITAEKLAELKPIVTAALAAK